ncbi:MAG: Rpn family recombination-promoting nuclease/putative transposase [Bacilli bacterium]|nr:Rpn family recombination-promoting nuclease/putative transposase [Bacilli bacterium]
MGLKDDASSNLMENEAYFADAVNCALYNGAHKVKVSDIKPYTENGKMITRRKKGRPRSDNRYRDVIKIIDDNMSSGLLACITAVENQSNVCRTMPARNMQYDSRTYLKQAGKLVKGPGEEILGMPEDSYLIPVVTIVINFSDRKWDQPLTLHELFEPRYKDSTLLDYVPDYRINLIDPYAMDDSEINMMSSCLREVLYTIKYSSDKKKLSEIVTSDPRFENMDENAKVFIEVFTEIKLPSNEKGGYNMCKAVREMIEERDSACKAVNEMREERDSACKAVNEMREERDSACKAVNEMREERDSAVNEAVSAIMSLMKVGNMSADDAMALINIPAEKREYYKSRIISGS